MRAFLRSIVIVLVIIITMAWPGTTLWAAEKNLAVADFSVFMVDPKIGDAVVEMLSTQLAQTGKVRLIERSRLKEILKEHELSLTGIVHPKQAIETGKISGAERVIIGSVGKLGIVIVLNARQIDTESGDVSAAWSFTGDREGDLPRMITQLVDKISSGGEKPATSTATLSAPAANRELGGCAAQASGYWISEWYDGSGKHPGSIYFRQNGSRISGWTLEHIGPAMITATFKDGSITGEYLASYGNGRFEFTLSQDCNRLIGSYTADHNVHGTWMAWRRPQPTADARVGQRVLVDWSGDFWTYPATIIKVGPNRIFVQFDDGDSEWTTTERVFPMDLEGGDPVFVAEAEKSGYTIGTLLEVQDRRAMVDYGDGKRRWELISRMRMLRVRDSGY